MVDNFISSANKGYVYREAQTKSGIERAIILEITIYILFRGYQILKPVLDQMVNFFYS